MADFPYTTVPGKLAGLFTKIRSTGVPPKASVAWLKQVGFTSSNDTSMIGVLKFIGLIDASSVPTPKWNAYRGKNGSEVLGDAIREGYAELFALYPDANQRSTTELDHVFRTSSSGGDEVIKKTIGTFKALVEQATFSQPNGQTELHLHSGPLHTPAAAPPVTQVNHSPTGPALHIDVQIHISPEASMEQVDKIFESMAKHLYGPKQGSA